MAAAADTVDAVEAVAASTIGEVEEEAEVITTEEDVGVEVGTMVVVAVVTMATKAATEANRTTLLRLCRAGGRHLQAVLSRHLPQVGCHPRNSEATRATKATEAPRVHLPPSAQRGWATPRNTAALHQDKLVATALCEMSSTTALQTRS
jgi:hypothetical protein